MGCSVVQAKRQLLLPIEHLVADFFFACLTHFLCWARMSGGQLSPPFSLAHGCSCAFRFQARPFGSIGQPFPRPFAGPPSSSSRTCNPSRPLPCPVPHLAGVVEHVEFAFLFVETRVVPVDHRKTRRSSSWRRRLRRSASALRPSKPSHRDDGFRT